MEVAEFDCITSTPLPESNNNNFLDYVKPNLKYQIYSKKELYNLILTNEIELETQYLSKEQLLENQTLDYTIPIYSNKIITKINLLIKLPKLSEDQYWKPNIESRLFKKIKLFDLYNYYVLEEQTINKNIEDSINISKKINILTIPLELYNVFPLMSLIFYNPMVLKLLNIKLNNYKDLIENYQNENNFIEIIPKIDFGNIKKYERLKNLTESPHQSTIIQTNKLERNEQGQFKIKVYEFYKLIIKCNDKITKIEIETEKNKLIYENILNLELEVEKNKKIYDNISKGLEIDNNNKMKYISGNNFIITCLDDIEVYIQYYNEIRFAGGVYGLAYQ